MRHFWIVLGLSTVLAACKVSLAQDSPGDATPILKPCTHKNPAPCIDKAPELIHWVEPEYSVAAHKNKIEGTVVLWAVIGTDGLAHDIRVARSLGYGLDELAIDALRKWTFKPAKSDKKAVPAQINVEMPFHYH